MQKNDGNIFDLSKIYDLDEEISKYEDIKDNDNLTEMLGYDFLNEEKAPGLNVRQINADGENVENRSLAEIKSEVNLQDKIDAISEVKEDLNASYGKVFNFEGVNLKNIRDFLETQVGKLATVEMIMGNDRLIDKIGMILAIGEDFLLLEETQTGNILVCPLKNIEFIRLNY